MVMVVAKPQRRRRRQLHNNGDGSTTMAAAPRRRHWLHDDGGGQTTMTALCLGGEVHWQNCEWAGGMTLLPSFFLLGSFPFRKGWESKKAFCLFRRVFSPRRRSQKLKTAAAMLALKISFSGLPHPRSNRPSRRRL
jgi:hypothetical protein